MSRWFAPAVLLAGALAIGVWFNRAAPQPPPLPPPSTGVAEITVHVGGAVASPGLVRVGPGARVADAIVAAGGFLATAETARVNLAAPVRDGERILVPERGGLTAAGTRAAGADAGLDVNTADATALTGLPGVGPVLAERIVAHREANGPFRTVEDLLDVPGIGEGKLASLREHVSIP